MVGMTPPRDNALSLDQPKGKPYSRAAHERLRKAARQQQREIVIDWAKLAKDSIEAFTRETCLEISSTRGRRLRVLDGGKFRRLTNGEFAILWNLAVRAGLDSLGVKLTVGKIENGLKAVGLMAPMPGEVAR